MARGLLERAIYGPEREQELVSAFLGERPGIFVEVGANDPVIESQTLHLERRGWTGLLVEPLAEMAAALRRQRKARVAEVACGAPAHHGTLMSFKVATTGSTLADDFTDADLVASEIRKVPVATLDSLLKQAGFAKVDFVSIDVEGFEIEVLAGFSLERYRPRLVLMEDRVRELTRHRHMLGRGYKLVRRTGLNSWYVPAETEFPISWFGRWQILRKYRLGVPFRAARDIVRISAKCRGSVNVAKY
ncbi:MAG: FkbM family methyltransferase [Xanthobacteraceae bacterium]|nr:FkbM family methyltransferase [Xanthobacteraceae bacterium]